MSNVITNKIKNDKMIQNRQKKIPNFINLLMGSELADQESDLGLMVDSSMKTQIHMGGNGAQFPTRDY